MLVYRVFPYLESAREGQPGHPLYEHTPQRGGRVDHPDYYVWYLSRNAEAACGEVFGNLAEWDESMLDFPLLPGARRALGTYSLPDDVRILDLDDPKQLVRLGLRPTQVVARNLSLTQAWGHQIWDERLIDDANTRAWDAVQWWSYHRPVWNVIASWHRPQFEHVTALSLDHPALREASHALMRPMK